MVDESEAGRCLWTLDSAHTTQTSPGRQVGSSQPEQTAAATCPSRLWVTGTHTQVPRLDITLVITFVCTPCMRAKVDTHAPAHVLQHGWA